VDHAIVLVGYGNETVGTFRPQSKDYWLVRNSWGSGWGEDGYIRIERFGALGEEPCETDTTPQDGASRRGAESSGACDSLDARRGESGAGTACKGGPSEITVCGLCGLLSDSSYPVGGATP